MANESLDPKTMRVVTLLAAAFLLVIPARASALIFGNFLNLGGASFHAADFLLGTRIDVTTEDALTHVGILFKNSGYNGQVGIYSDAAGAPGSLLASTAPFFVSEAGHLEVPVLDQVLLPVGTYWFMAVYGSFGVSVGMENGGGDDLIAYQPLEFGSALPDPFGVPITYTGPEVNYYLVTATVPEPATALLLVLGLTVLAVRRRSFTR